MVMAAAICALLAACETVRTATGELTGEIEQVGLHVPVWQMSHVAWTPAEPAAAYGEPRVNRSVLGSPLRVARLDFEQGIGVGGDALLVFTPGGRSTRIEFMAGIDDASPDTNGSAQVELRSDGAVLWQATLRRGRSPEKCSASIPNAHHLVLRISASTGTYTDILLPRMQGVPGLRAALQQGRQAHEDALFAVPERLAASRVLLNGAVLFPCEYQTHGTCIGMSNQHICVVLAPHRGGAIVHCGPSLRENLLAAPSVLELHPRDRRVTEQSVAHSGVWKWRVDRDGTLRMLSPADPVHGVRWSRTVALVPDQPALRTTVLVKNTLQHAISFSTGVRICGATPDDVMLPPNTRTTGWVLLRNGADALLVAPEEPRHGLYPYNGLRVRAANGAALVFSELTPLAAQEFGASEQYWVLGSWQINQQETLQALEHQRDAARAAWRTWRGPPGTPTGRTQADAVAF